MKTWWKKDIDQFTSPTSGAASVQSNNVAGGDQYINSPIVPQSMPVTIDQGTIKEYLKSKGCVLWMDWQITSDAGLEEASYWLSNEFYNIVVFSATRDSGNEE